MVLIYIRILVRSVSALEMKVIAFLIRECLPKRKIFELSRLVMLRDLGNEIKSVGKHYE